MSKDNELSYAESARIGQATNLAYNRLNQPGLKIPTVEMVIDTVFKPNTGTLHIITAVRQEYIKRKDGAKKAIESNEVNLDV